MRRKVRCSVELNEHRLPCWEPRLVSWGRTGDVRDYLQTKPLEHFVCLFCGSYGWIGNFYSVFWHWNISYCPGNQLLQQILQLKPINISTIWSEWNKIWITTYLLSFSSWINTTSNIWQSVTLTNLIVFFSLVLVFILLFTTLTVRHV